MAGVDIPTGKSPALPQKAGSTNEPATVVVWDPFVRFFHWSLVASFAIAYLSGDELDSLHEYSGYVVLALVGLRLVWGVVGSKYARFSNFVTGPRPVLTHLRAVARGKARRYLGHNPAGGAMIVALLLMIILSGASGIATLNAPPHLAEIWEEIHELAANLTLVLVGIHIAGVIVMSLLEGENLPRAMWTGRKRKEINHHR